MSKKSILKEIAQPDLEIRIKIFEAMEIDYDPTIAAGLISLCSYTKMGDLDHYEIILRYLTSEKPRKPIERRNITELYLVNFQKTKSKIRLEWKEVHAILSTLNLSPAVLPELIGLTAKNQSTPLLESSGTIILLNLVHGIFGDKGPTFIIKQQENIKKRALLLSTFFSENDSVYSDDWILAVKKREE